MKYTCLFCLLAIGTFSYGQLPVNAEEDITIGGIRQFITIKGKNNTLPLLLFLHGGPGGSVMGYAEKFTKRLQEHFLVVQWDQRQTGRTLALNESTTPLSLAIFQADTYEIIQALLKKYGRQKLYLAGHSWGTALGFHIARTHPELLYAYIPIGAMVNQLQSERVALSVLKQHALTKGNKKEVEELARINIPFENGEQLYYHRKWLLQYAGSTKALTLSFVQEWAATWLNVFNEASKDNLVETLPRLDCPVYFMAGRKDLQTNSLIAEAYYATLAAPKKGFFWFENSGHSIPSTEPSLLQKIIIEKILPETFIIEKPATLISTQ